MAIPIRTPGEIDAIARTADVVSLAINAAADSLVPGMTTLQLADLARDALLKAGAETLFDKEVNKTGDRFPHSVSVCVNEQAVHGVPGDRVLQAGDLVTVDVGGRLDSWCADLARSAVVGVVRVVGEDAQSPVLDAARSLCDLACNMCVAGMAWADITDAVSAAADRDGVHLLAEFTGHGIGRNLHEQPATRIGPRAQGSRSSGERSRDTAPPIPDLILRPGMVITIEPIVCERPVGTILDPDGWTVRTRDGSFACYEERMVAITRGGPRILGIQS